MSVRNPMYSVISTSTNIASLSSVITKPMFSEFRALVIDDQLVMRSILRNQLKSIGITRVTQVATGEEALTLLAKERFNIVLADYNLGSGITGLQVLEQAKGLGILSDDVVWLVVSAESSKEFVSISADQAPDDYIIKPFSESLLQTRLVNCLERRQALQTYYEALSNRQPDEAIVHARCLADSKGKFANEGTKQLGRLLLKLGRYEDALSTYSAFLENQASQPFAALGKAKALKGVGANAEARTLIADLIAKHPDFVGAYDTLFEIHESTGEAIQAFNTLKAAAQIVPSVKRHMTVGSIAMALGQRETALKSFERACAHCAIEQMHDLEDVAAIIQAHVDNRSYQRALALSANPWPQFESMVALQTLMNAVKAQAYKGEHLHNESRAAYAQCKESIDYGCIDKRVLQSCLSAAVAHGDYRETEKLAVHLVANNHEDIWLRKAISETTNGTFQAARIEDLMRQEVEKIRAAMNSIKYSEAKGDFGGAVRASGTLVDCAPLSRVAQVSMANALINALTKAEHPERFIGLAEEHMERLKANYPGDTDIEMLIRRLRYKVLEGLQEAYVVSK